MLIIMSHVCVCVFAGWTSMTKWARQANTQNSVRFNMKLYVFQVNNGSTLTFDTDLAVQTWEIGILPILVRHSGQYFYAIVTYDKLFLCLSVLELKHAIQAKYKIATQHQVLVVNGGECMAAERRVCSYSAGTVSLDTLFVCLLPWRYTSWTCDVLSPDVFLLILRKPTPYSFSTKRWSCVTGILRSLKPPSRLRARFRLKWKSLYWCQLSFTLLPHEHNLLW